MQGDSSSSLAFRRHCPQTAGRPTNRPPRPGSQAGSLKQLFFFLVKMCQKGANLLRPDSLLLSLSSSAVMQCKDCDVSAATEPGQPLEDFFLGSRGRLAGTKTQPDLDMRRNLKEPQNKRMRTSTLITAVFFHSCAYIRSACVCARASAIRNNRACARACAYTGFPVLKPP